MILLYFENDYSEGAHPKIMERLLETNLEPLSGSRFRSLLRLSKGKDPRRLPAARMPRSNSLWGGTQNKCSCHRLPAEAL